MTGLPGGEMSSRPLHFFWLCDTSGSMSLDGKIENLNEAIRLALPKMKQLAHDNPNADVYIQTMQFSHEPKWLLPEPVALDGYEWIDLKADELQQTDVDIVFLIDTSGSMSDEIDAVKKSCVDFANNIIESGTKVNLGLIGFDIGGHRSRFNVESVKGVISSAPTYKVHNLFVYTIGIWELTSPSEFKENIKPLTLGLFGGGGCYLADENTLDIFPHVISTFKNPDHKKILVIISDEMGSNDATIKIVKMLKEHQIQTFVLGVKENKGAHERIAKETEGKFWDINASKGVNDFTSLLGTVSGTIAKELTKTLSDGYVATGTDMGKALMKLSEKLDMPPMPQRGLPPVIVLVSDGQPTDDFNAGLEVLFSKPWGKKAVRLAIGIGQDADMECLQKFIANVEIKPLHANSSKELVEYIKWFSSEALKSGTDAKKFNR